MNRRLLAATVTSLAVAAGTSVLAVPSMSSAETIPGMRMGYDSGKDVYAEFIPDGSSSGGPGVVDPTRAIGDIHHWRITHETKVVRVSVKYRALPKAGEYNRHTVYIGTGRTAIEVNVEAGPGNWAGTKSVTRAGRTVSCPNLVSRIDYGHRMFVVQIPRTCLGNPHWVRVDAYLTTHVHQAGGYRSFVDFAFTKGFVDGSDLSKRVYEPTFQNTGGGPGGLQ